MQHMARMEKEHVAELQAKAAAAVQAITEKYEGELAVERMYYLSAFTDFPLKIGSRMFDTARAVSANSELLVL